MLRGSVFKVFLVVVAWLADSRAHAQIPEGWEIVEIFPAGTEYYCGPPDINDKGQIVFERRLWPSFTDREIFLHNGDRLVQLTHDDIWDAFPRINNHGEVVWQRDLDPDPDLERFAIVRWRNGVIDTIAEPPEDFYLQSPDINDAEWIVWYRPFSGTGPYTASIQFFNGSDIISIPNEGMADQTPRINNANQIVWTRYDFRRGRNTIMLYDNGSIHPLDGGPERPERPHLNEQRQVVWTLYQAGLDLWIDGQTTRLVPNNAAGATINDCGLISFSRWDTKH